MANNIYKNLFYFSIKSGLDAILNWRINIESIKRIVCPIDVARYYELPVVAKNLRLSDSSSVLDISSPKLLTYYLADRNKKVNFTAIDKFKQELKSWKFVIGEKENILMEYGDARNLKYNDNSFDEVYSVSVIEHLGKGSDQADTKMMEEVYRVLKNGGRFYLTTIVSRNKENVFLDKKYYSDGRTINKKTFFCRIYDYGSIQRRLIKPTKFKVIKEEFCNYKYTFYEQIFNKFVPFSVFLGWLNLFIAPRMVSTTSKPSNISKRAEYFAIFQK